jgi:hypothetical protein
LAAVQALVAPDLGDADSTDPAGQAYLEVFLKALDPGIVAEVVDMAIADEQIVLETGKESHCNLAAWKRISRVRREVR